MIIAAKVDGRKYLIYDEPKIIDGLPYGIMRYEDDISIMIMFTCDIERLHMIWRRANIQTWYYEGHKVERRGDLWICDCNNYKFSDDCKHIQKLKFIGDYVASTHVSREEVYYG